MINKKGNRKKDYAIKKDHAIKNYTEKNHIEGEFMNLDITGIHLDITDGMRNYINKKLHRLEFATNYIIDLLFRLIKEKHGYKIETTINLKWGTSAHVHVDGFDIYESIDKLFDKIEAKVKKEKNKVQQH